MTVRYSIRFLISQCDYFRRKESIAQFEEEELTSSVKRIIQEVFVCHHDRTRTISYITKSGIVRGRSWALQILSDAWESMIAEPKLAIEVPPRMLIMEPLEVECGKFYVWSANVETHGHMGSCPGYALLIWQGKATKPREDEFRERIERNYGENLGRRSQDENISGQNR